MIGTEIQIEDQVMDGFTIFATKRRMGQAQNAPKTTLTKLGRS
jgi:hypothetical protein